MHNAIAVFHRVQRPYPAQANKGLARALTELGEWLGQYYEKVMLLSIQTI
jgi:hypothetical protein